MKIRDYTKPELDYYPPTLAISGDNLVITPASLAGSGAGHSAIKYMATTVYFIG